MKKIIGDILKWVLFAMGFIIIGLCSYIAFNPHVLRPVVLNDPMRSGWITIGASMVIGAAFATLIIVLFKRPLFAVSLSTIETEENRKLTNELASECEWAKTLEKENKDLRVNMSAMRTKIYSGISTIQGAFNNMGKIEGEEG